MRQIRGPASQFPQGVDCIGRSFALEFEGVDFQTGFSVDRRLQHGYPMLGWRNAGRVLMRRHAGGYQFDSVQIRPFPYLQSTTQMPEMYRVEASSVNANAGRHEGRL